MAIAFANRAALTRAVTQIVTTTDVRQFIDLGSGLPTVDPRYWSTAVRCWSGTT